MVEYKNYVKDTISISNKIKERLSRYLYDESNSVDINEAIAESKVCKGRLKKYGERQEDSASSQSEK